MLDVITMSSKGQFVVPREIREIMGLQVKDKFIIVNDKDSILLKKITREEAAQSMRNLMDKVSAKFKKSGIKYSDIDREVLAARAK